MVASMAIGLQVSKAITNQPPKSEQLTVMVREIALFLIEYNQGEKQQLSTLKWKSKQTMSFHREISR